ncbi:protein kinase domain-containing protein [Acaryochloris marina NIES-2412]|uniref:protein kinase domain-containing protein n=1 Tax=Acaryochloris marina TaxID=155978 RepID=UPI004059DD47
MTITTDQIGKYAIVREIAQGGFGRTLLAEDPEGKRVVLKQFHPQQHNISSQALRLFDQECELLKKIGHHDQIPSFIEYFEDGDDRFISQEWIPGNTLRQELDESGTFTEQEIIDLLLDILPVIQFVHQKKVIHRDIKPENIIRRTTDSKLVLVDFGASKPLETTIVAETGTSIGSVKFVSPEQARGKATYASDIYSLGLTCAHLLTYASPFEFEDVETGTLVWRNFCKQPITEGLALIIDKMLERGLKNRYSKASQVLEALTELEEQGKDSLDPESTFPWEQQEDEPDAWFERFEIYLHLTSGERDVPTAYFLADKRDSSLEKWVTFANRFQWETRANAYDESAIGGFLKHVQEEEKSGALSRAMQPIVAFGVAVGILVLGVKIIIPDSPQVIQEPSPIEQPAQEPESDDGILPRFPILDDLKDYLVADMGHSKELVQSFNHMFFVMKIMVIIVFMSTILISLWMSARWMINTERN